MESTRFLRTPISLFQPLSLQDVLCIILLPDRLPMPSYAVQGGECLPGRTSLPVWKMPLIASSMPRSHLREVRSHADALEWHSACSRACVAEDHAAPPACFPTE